MIRRSWILAAIRRATLSLTYGERRHGAAGLVGFLGLLAMRPRISDRRCVNAPALAAVIERGGQDTPQGASILVSHDYLDQNVRVVAFDKRGALQKSTPGGGAGAGKVWLERHNSPELKRDDIDHFEFQTRDYEYVKTTALPLESNPAVVPSPGEPSPSRSPSP